MDYKNLTFNELKSIMRDFNRINGIERKCDTKNGIKMVAKVVMKLGTIRDEFQEDFCDIDTRTLYFTNYEKALCPNDFGYSIFASNEYTTERIEYWVNDDFELCQIIEINGKEVK